MKVHFSYVENGHFLMWSQYIPSLIFIRKVENKFLNILVYQHKQAAAIGRDLISFGLSCASLLCFHCEFWLFGFGTVMKHLKLLLIGCGLRMR